MYQLPDEYIDPLLEILKWCNETFCYDPIEDELLNRFINRLIRIKFDKEQPLLSKDTLNLVNDCLNNANNNLFQCGVNDKLVVEITNWYRQSTYGDQFQVLQDKGYLVHNHGNN